MTDVVKTHEEILAEIDRLKAEAAAVKSAERSDAISRVKALMADHGVTLADLGKPAKTRKPVPAKFRDPHTGKQWSGRGRAPTWVNRETMAVQ